MHRFGESMGQSYDIAVIGAGPVGSVAAFAFARRGARVLLLEANPASAERFAGEWLHPPGVRVLERFGLTPLADGAGEMGQAGFVVYPDDASPPIELPYPHRERGLTWRHRELVAALRRRASAHQGVTYLPHARVTELDDQQVTFLDVRPGHQRRARAGLVVAADGGTSISRPPKERAHNGVVSYMGALTLRGVDLPHEGYGHVILGGPGPVLLYRLDADCVRLSLDVPAEASALRRDHDQLLAAFRRVLPAALAPSFASALANERIHWAATRFRPRTNYGSGRLAVVGDAVGTFHPLTAAGMTVGMQDVAELIDADVLADYVARRAAASYVPELLSSALYQIFADPTEAAERLRQAVYANWRAHPTECERTMRLLSGAETRASVFVASFLRVGLRAMSATAMPSLVRWSGWPLASMLPEPMKQRLRRKSSIAGPFPPPPRFLSVPTKQAMAALSRLLPTS